MRQGSSLQGQKWKDKVMQVQDEAEATFTGRVGRDSM